MHQGIDFGLLARELLTCHGYTTKSLGDAIGLSQPSVSRLARGVTRQIGAASALRLIELAGGTVRAPEKRAVEVGGAKDQEPHHAG